MSKMLKWLVQRSADPPEDVVTDDPLATLEGQIGGGGEKKRGRGKAKEIYSVNRTNPLYSDDDDDVVVDGDGSSEGDGRGEHHEGIHGGGRRSSKGLIVVGSNSSASSGYLSNATSSAINSSRGRGSTPPRLLIPASQNGIIARQTDVFRALREQSEGGDNGDGGGNGNGESPGNSIVQTTINVLPAPVWPPRMSEEDRDKSGEAMNDPGSSQQVLLNIVRQDPRYVSKIAMFKDAGNRRGGAGSNLGREVEKDLRVSVLRNEHFVKSIEVGGVDIVTKSDIEEEEGEERMRRRPNQSAALERHDSIVTDSLLQMTSFTPSQPTTASAVAAPAKNHDDDFDLSLSSSETGSPRPQAKEDMDKVIRELTHAVIKSRNVATLSRAFNGRSVPGSSIESRRSIHRLRSSLRGLKKHLRQTNSGSAKGPVGAADAMRELWQKTGMKTNGGRKLIADSSVSETEQESTASGVGKSSLPSSRYKRRSRRRSQGTTTRFGKVAPAAAAAAAAAESRKKASFSSTSSSGSSYGVPFNRPQRVTGFYAGGVGSEYSTAIYAELYNGSNSGGGGGGERSGGVANAGFEEGDDERSVGSTNSDNSGSGGIGVNKKVKFNESVAVKEFKGVMSRGADLYHKMDIGDGRRSTRVHPRDGNGVVINVGDVSERHPWEKFYGVDSADGSVGKSDYRNIFTSPYFDYRRTHSKPGGNPSNKTYSDVDKDLPLQVLSSRFLRPESKSLLRPMPNICYYWKAILTVFFAGAVLVAIVVLTLYYTRWKGSGRGDADTDPEN